MGASTRNQQVRAPPPNPTPAPTKHSQTTHRTLAADTYSKKRERDADAFTRSTLRPVAAQIPWCALLPQQHSSCRCEVGRGGVMALLPPRTSSPAAPPYMLAACQPRGATCKLLLLMLLVLPSPVTILRGWTQPHSTAAGHVHGPDASALQHSLVLRPVGTSSLVHGLVECETPTV